MLRNVTLPESIVRNFDRDTLLATRFNTKLDTESETETDSDGKDMFNSLMLNDTRVLNCYNDTDREIQAILRKRTAFLDGFGGHAPEADAECSVCYRGLTGRIRVQLCALLGLSQPLSYSVHFEVDGTRQGQLPPL